MMTEQTAEKKMEWMQAEVDRLRAERDDALREVDQLMGKIAECRDAFGGVGLIEDLGLLHGAVGCPYEVPGYVRQQVARLRAERDELIEMLRETLKYGISDSRRKEAYDLVVRLGGYQGKTEG